MRRMIREWFIAQTLKIHPEYNKRMRIEASMLLKVNAKLKKRAAKRQIFEIIKIAVENGKGLAIMTNLKTKSSRFLNGGNLTYE